MQISVYGGRLPCPERQVEALSCILQTSDFIEELLSTLDNPAFSTTLSIKAHRTHYYYTVS